MFTLAVTIFAVTYTGVAFGRIPGLTLDRTGIALLGAIAMIVCGVLTSAQAVQAIDLTTILLLYGLMVVSAQLRLGGFYTWAAFRITALLSRPRLFLMVTMLLSGTLSAVLTNDIVCLAFTPVLAASLVKSGLNPLPFLMGLAVSSNIGSAATIIGNPQNMLIGQMGRLDFAAFLQWCIPPAVLSLAVAHPIICLFYRNRFQLASPPPLPEMMAVRWPPFNPWQSAKGIAAAILLMAMFFTSAPRELSAIAVAGVLLCSRRMKSREMLELVDWHLMTLFCALFVIIRAITQVGLPPMIMDELNRFGLNITAPAPLAAISALASNLVSNVPATMLLIQFLDPGNPLQWYILAVSSTFAGNLIVIGSIANLIVIEQAARFGIHISFAEHARIGVPVTVFSLAVLIGWIYI